MKHSPLLLVLVITFHLNNLYSQERITIEPAVIDVPAGKAPALSVKVHQAMQPAVMKSWQKEVTEDVNRKWRKTAVVTGNSYTIDSIYVNEISDKPLNLISNFTQKDDGVVLVAAFNVEGSFADSGHPVLYERASKYLRDFAAEGYRDAVGVEIKAEELKLEKLNMQLEQLVKENTKLRKSIASYEQDTIDMKQEIAIQEKLLEAKNNESLQQEVNVSRARKDPVQYKEQRKILNSFRKEKKQISNRITKNERSIVASVADINKAHRQIQLNEEAQKKQMLLIEEQMKKIDAVREKQDRIS